MTRSRALLALVLVATATPALAHPGGLAAHGFIAGAMHPLGGADHVAAMLAAGLWAGSAGGQARILWPAVFLTAMLGGFAVAAAGFVVPFAEAGIAASVVALLAAALFGARVPAALGAAACGLFAAFHGLAHGAEMPAGAATAAYVSGFMVSTAALLTTGAVLGRFVGAGRFMAPLRA